MLFIWASIGLSNIGPSTFASTARAFSFSSRVPSGRSAALGAASCTGRDCAATGVKPMPSSATSSPSVTRSSAPLAPPSLRIIAIAAPSYSGQTGPAKGSRWSGLGSAVPSAASVPPPSSSTLISRRSARTGFPAASTH